MVLMHARLCDSFGGGCELQYNHFTLYTIYNNAFIETKRTFIYNMTCFNLLSRYVMDWCSCFCARWLLLPPLSHYPWIKALFSGVYYYWYIEGGNCICAYIRLYHLALILWSSLMRPLFSNSHPIGIIACTTIYRGTLCGSRHGWGGGVYGYGCGCAWWGGWRWQRQWCRIVHVDRYACECWQQVHWSAAAAATSMHCCHGRLFPPWAMILVPQKGRFA